MTTYHAMHIKIYIWTSSFSGMPGFSSTILCTGKLIFKVIFKGYVYNESSMLINNIYSFIWHERGYKTEKSIDNSMATQVYSFSNRVF